MADSVSTSNDGTIVWKVEPGCINELIIGLRNGDDPAKQKKDSKGRDLGIVLRSVEFLKHDLDFEMSGVNFINILHTNFLYFDLKMNDLFHSLS